MKNNKYELNRENIKSKEFLIPFSIIIGFTIAGIATDFIFDMRGKIVTLMFIEFIAFFGIVAVLGKYAKMKDKRFEPKFTWPIIIISLILVALIYLKFIYVL
jgi:uncharacterized membrane protein YcaP (DUF421 family)